MVLLALFGGYVVTSLILLKFPNLLHKKKHVKIKAKHISHRGGAGENLENTMAAFKHAYDVGTEMLEIDCQLTKDGQVVVCHDNQLMRVAGEDVSISDLDYKDLPPLKNSLALDFHSSYVTCCKSGDRQIPLLKDVFLAFPELAMNIDAKQGNDEIVQKIHELIVSFERQDITIWSNFRKNVTAKLYEKDPEIPVAFAYESVLTLLILFYTGLLPFFPLKESYLEVVFPRFLKDQSRFKRPVSTKQKIIGSVGQALLMRPALIQHLAKRGIPTYIWVLNEEHEFDEAFKLGAAGIMTDFPTKLTHYLNNRQHVSKDG